MLSFVTHNNVPTAVVMVIKQSAKAHGSLVFVLFFFSKC